jgi:hypothetical protein
MHSKKTVSDDYLKLFLISLFFGLTIFAWIDIIFDYQLSIANLFLISCLIFTTFYISAVFIISNEDGWKAFIPIYNIIVILKIVKKPKWLTILLFLPFANLIFIAWLTHQLAKKFNKGIEFTIGLLLLPIVFYPILANEKKIID